MRIGELARRGDVSQKAARYCERLGLVVPGRSGNGYRDHDESHCRVVAGLRDLAASGIAPGRAAPFVKACAPVMSTATTARPGWRQTATASPRSTVSSRHSLPGGSVSSGNRRRALPATLRRSHLR